jgi:hypothetical protein
VARIFQNPYSRNVFGKTTLHIAASDLDHGTIWPLFLGKRDTDWEEQINFLLMPSIQGVNSWPPYGYNMNGLHLAASSGRYSWQNGRTLATLQKILSVEAALSEHRPPMPAEQPRKRLAISRDSNGDTPMEVLEHTIYVWNQRPHERSKNLADTLGALDIVCEMLPDLENSFDEKVCMALLDLRGCLRETIQTKKLWDAVSSRKQGAIADTMAELYTKLLPEGPGSRDDDGSLWEARMTGIVDFNPDIIKKEDASGNTMLMKYLLDPEPSLKKAQIRFLANAHGKYFEWKGYSTYHFQYLKSTCSSPPILNSLKALGADLSLRDSEGEALLHFFGHNTQELENGEQMYSHRHNIFTCPYLDSAEDLRVLLLGNGKLFDCNSQGITALSVILNKIRCHIGYVAFVLLCLCGLNNDLWPESGLWAGRYRKFKGTTLLEFLSLIIAAYKRRDPTAGSRTIEISLNNELLTSLSVEDVTQEEVMKYGNEIDVLRKKWDSLMDIENEKWHSDPSAIEATPETEGDHLMWFRSNDRLIHGEYKKGPWVDQLAWAQDFFSEGDRKKMEDCLCNAEYMDFNSWERIKIRRSGEKERGEQERSKRSDQELASMAWKGRRPPRGLTPFDAWLQS